ncbi:GATA-type domain-containing protein [Fusarium acuminatum]|uniref:GATA-type domain-containing protein n=1 Tax=Fusarium acuminatum TaxID=5515 RepID=A0ABZ2XC43_9HYPO
MTFSAEPRKQADYHESPGRQSLPSISEAIQGTEPGPYTSRPPSWIQTGFSLSPPFALARRSLPKAEKHPYLQQLLPASSFPPRQHALPVFSDSPRPPFTSPPSLLPVSNFRQSPSAMAEIPPQHHHPEQQKTPEPHQPLCGVYAHPPPPCPPPAPVTYQPHQLRPGQIPLPAYPTSPRHDYATPARYDATVNRHVGSWSYQDALSRISSSSRTILHCAEAYSRLAREQHGAHLIPKRLPTEWELSDMLSNMELIKRSLEYVKDLVQTSIQIERTREGGKMKYLYKKEHHAPIYGHAIQPSLDITEIKKRRAVSLIIRGENAKLTC